MTGQCPPSHLLEASQETGYDCYVSVISVPFVSRVSRVSRVPSVGESLCISLDPNGSNTDKTKSAVLLQIEDNEDNWRLKSLVQPWLHGSCDSKLCWCKLCVFSRFTIGKIGNWIWQPHRISACGHKLTLSKAPWFRWSRSPRDPQEGILKRSEKIWKAFPKLRN